MLVALRDSLWLRPSHEIRPIAIARMVMIVNGGRS
jgi:hypothetical protein